MVQIKNTQDLRDVLIDEVHRIRDGETDYKRATTVSTLAGKILMSAKLDLDVARSRKMGKLESGSEPLSLVKK